MTVSKLLQDAMFVLLELKHDVGYDSDSHEAIQAKRDIAFFDAKKTSIMQQTWQDDKPSKEVTQNASHPHPKLRTHKKIHVHPAVSLTMNQVMVKAFKSRRLHLL